MSGRRNDGKPRMDVYVKALNVSPGDRRFPGLRSQEIDDGVVIDWWRDSNGVEHVAGVEVLAARSVSVDGRRFAPLRGDEVDPQPLVLRGYRPLGAPPDVTR